MRSNDSAMCFVSVCVCSKVNFTQLCELSYLSGRQFRLSASIIRSARFILFLFFNKHLCTCDWQMDSGPRSHVRSVVFLLFNLQIHLFCKAFHAPIEKSISDCL